MFGKVVNNLLGLYNEINPATLTGAIDVIVVEQEDGSYQCSPFHVRFGKLGVLRSKEKIVDIEINGSPAEIHMKLGHSGEAFFVVECDDDIPAEMATSPIPDTSMPCSSETEMGISDLTDIGYDDEHLRPKLRRNSFTKEDHIEDINSQNQVSDYSQRRHTDRLVRPDLSVKNEMTTLKFRQEIEKHIPDGSQVSLNKQDIVEEAPSTVKDTSGATNTKEIEPVEKTIVREDSKSKKKRKKKSALKKKNSQRLQSMENNENSNVQSVSTPAADILQKSEPKSTDSSPNVDSKAKDNSSNDSSSIEDNKDTAKETVVNRGRELDIHFFSDTEVTTNIQGSRPSTPIQSDSEIELTNRLIGNEPDVQTNSWKWGELPVTNDVEETENASEEQKQAQKNFKLSNMFSFMKQNNKLNMRKSQSEGLYLSDLVSDSMDPSIAARYFMTDKMNRTEDDRESGNGPSIPHSPNSVDGAKSIDSSYDDDLNGRPLEFSLCGGLENGQVPTKEQFNKHIISYFDVCENPDIYSSPNLVVRLSNKYVSKNAFCAMVMTSLAFEKPLPDSIITQMFKQQTEEISSAKSNSIQIPVTEEPKSLWNRYFSRGKANGSVPKDDILTEEKPNGSPNTTKDQSGIDSSLNESTEIGSVEIKQNELADDSLIKEKFKKSLRLDSDTIKRLKLKPGMNEVVFSVTTAFQGTSRCNCYLYLWKYNDTVVISDVDGTITRSDVLGHLLPYVGKDWAQTGVAELFTKIYENGYKLLYLSARAIGQSRSTRDYLRSINQRGLKLPEGPVLLNPTSLLSAFHREVIEKKPELFKIDCMNDIKALFPDKNPFYAGYGNKINDVWAYRAVGIPISRIFTINTKGELKHELTQTFHSTYSSMAYIVDQLFPPVKKDVEESIEYSNFNFWREPVPDIDVEFLSGDGQTN